MAEPAPRSAPVVPVVRTGAGHLPGLPGVVVGHAHATGDGWATGCTVVLPPPGTVGGVAVGGGAPGTRETDALAPGTLVSTVDAVVLSGGSAYGLASADGVIAWCEEVGRGFVVSPPGTPEVRVPIVPAAVVFDLGRGGDPSARPTAAFGRAACEAAGELLDAAEDRDPAAALPQVPEGPVGAGTGARVAAGTAPGGVGVAARTVPAASPADVSDGRVSDGGVSDGRVSDGGVSDGRVSDGRVSDGRVSDGGVSDGRGWAVAAVVVANAAGVPLGAAADAGGHAPAETGMPGLLNTTLACVVTDAALDSASATRLARAAHAGLARAVEPSHTLVDGDVVFALATGTAPAPSDVRARVGLETAAARALTEAFARAVAGGTMAG